MSSNRLRAGFIGLGSQKTARSQGPIGNPAQALNVLRTTTVERTVRSAYNVAGI